LNFQFVLFGAAGSMNQMSVRIHKAWQNHPAPNIDLLCVSGSRVFLDLRSSTNRDDLAVADQHRAISDYAHVGEGMPSAR